MNEWILLAYPVVLIACLMLAARWQPKDSPTPVDDRDPGARAGHSSRHARNETRWSGDR